MASNDSDNPRSYQERLDRDREVAKALDGMAELDSPLGRMLLGGAVPPEFHELRAQYEQLMAVDWIADALSPLGVTLSPEESEKPLPGMKRLISFTNSSAPPKRTASSPSRRRTLTSGFLPFFASNEISSNQRMINPKRFNLKFVNFAAAALLGDSAGS